METTIIAIAGFAVLLLALVALRYKTGSKYEIRNTDIILAIMPVVMWLLLTGRVQEFAFGDLKIVSAIQQASQTSVKAQVSAMPVETLETDAKRGVMDIPRLVASKAKVLSFQLGHGGYNGNAIGEYLSTLTRHPDLRYIVINDEGGKLWCMAEARPLARVFEAGDFGYSAYDFARWLNEGNRDALRVLPGFVAADFAVDAGTNKQEALTRMESQDVDVLPVVNETGQFKGVVDRSKLTASLLVDIAARVEQ